MAGYSKEHMDGEKFRKIIYINDVLYEKARELCFNRKWSFSQLIRTALEQYLKRSKKRQ